MDGHVGDVLGLEIFADVDFVFRRHDDFADAAASGGEHLFFDAADGQDLAREGDFAGHGEVGADAALRKHRHQRGGHRDAGGGAVFGDGAGGHVDVDVDGFEKLGINAVLGGGAAHPGEGGLHGFRSDAGGGAVFGDGAGGHVDVDVDGFEKLGINAVLGGGAAHPGEGGLHGFLHYGSQLAG